MFKLIAVSAIAFLTFFEMPCIAQNVSPAMQQLLDSKDDARCKSFGAKPGTEVYINCRLKMQELRAQSFKPAMAQPVYVPPPFKMPEPYQLPPPVHMQMPRQTNCTSNVIGQQVYTNCQQN